MVLAVVLAVVLAMVPFVAVVSLSGALGSLLGDRPDGGKWAGRSMRLGGPTVRGRDGKPLDPGAPALTTQATAVIRTNAARS